MKEIKNIATFTYDMGNNWRIDVVHKGYEIDAWIYHDAYGVKLFMFGEMTKPSTSITEFMELVEANFDDYKSLYEADYMDAEDWENQKDERESYL